MAKKNSFDNIDVIVPSTKKETKKTKVTAKPKKTSKSNIIEEEDVVFNKPKKTAKKPVKNNNIIEEEEVNFSRGRKTTKKPAKNNIIEEEEVVFSRVKKNDTKENISYSRSKNNTYRKKDKKLESLIEEINKDHSFIEEEEVLDIPVNNKKVTKNKPSTNKTNKIIIDEDPEVLDVPKDNEETIVLSRINKKKVFENPETMVLPNYNKEIKKIEKKVEEKKKQEKTETKKVEKNPITNKNQKKKKKKYKVKKKALALVIFILLVAISSVTAFVIYKNKLRREEEERLRIENYIKDVESHYSEKVKTNKDATLYKKINNNYQVYGTLYKDNIMSITKEDVTENTKYFYNEDLDVYIEYQNVDPEKEEVVKDDRYKKYIPFNENIITNDEYIIYHNDDTKYYKLSESSEYPIIIKKSDKYYFEYQDELVYVMKDDVKETKKAENTKATPVSSVPVLNYHHIYDPKEKTCNQSICMTTTRYREHIKWFKENNILDLTMKEFEMFMNNEIRLPKSVLVTHDDGWMRQNAIKILDEEQFHATYFLVTSWYLPIESKYVEYHSHTHNMHNQGECKTGQGGGIQCLSETKIQEDLAKSREILNNTTYFCYPFYEWNDYAISQLKKAGFTLAFIGGQRAAKPSDNHYRIPRYVIYSWTTTSNLKQYFK